jgi:hypothetical protein
MGVDVGGMGVGRGVDVNVGSGIGVKVGRRTAATVAVGVGFFLCGVAVGLGDGVTVAVEEALPVNALVAKYEAMPMARSRNTAPAAIQAVRQRFGGTTVAAGSLAASRAGRRMIG